MSAVALAAAMQLCAQHPNASAARGLDLGNAQTPACDARKTTHFLLFIQLLIPLVWQLLPTTAYHSVDESVVCFKGKQSFKQYMPLKPTQQALKCGYVQTLYCVYHAFDYRGKESNGSGLGTRAVKKFTEELAKMGCA